MIEDRATTGIVFPPPLVYIIGFAVGYLWHKIWPLAIVPGGWSISRVVGWCLVVGAVGLIASAIVTFFRAGTTPNPAKPATTMVTSGPYKFTRNPMYLAWAAAYLGASLIANSLATLLLLPFVLLVIGRAVIDKEERYLGEEFGATYKDYAARVRRWL